MHVTENYEMRE